MNRIRASSQLAAGIRKNVTFSQESESRGILSRVSQLSEILSNEHTSYTEKSRQCYEYYKKSQLTREDMELDPNENLAKPRLNLIQDVSRYREINTDVIKRICFIFTKSSSMRAFLLQEVLENIRHKDFESMISAYELMEEYLLLSEEQSVQVSVLYNRISKLKTEYINKLKMQQGKNLKIELINWESVDPGSIELETTQEVLHIASNLLLSICIHSGESLLAVALAGECQKISPDYRKNIKPAILDGILISLSIYDPLLHHYKSYAIFKMLRLFSSESVPLATLFKMISNMSVDAKNPFFVNMLFDHVTRDSRITKLSELEPALLELYLPILKNLIAINLHHGNVYRAANLWMSFQSEHDIHDWFLERNSVLLEAILHELLNKDVYKREQTVEKLLIHVDYEKYPHLLDFALKFYGEKPSPKFESLVKLLKPPLGRSTLSALFSALLAQNKEKAAERIMQTIFRTQRGLNSSDFEVIVKKLLSQNKVAECIDMFQDASFLVASRGAMHILTYLLRRKRKMAEKERRKDKDKVRKNLERGEKLKNGGKELAGESEKDGGFRDNLSKVYDEYVAEFITKMQSASDSWPHFTVTLIRFISQNINNRVSRRIYEQRAFGFPKNDPSSLNLDLLNLPSQLEQFVTINMTNRVSCLMVILKQALLEKDRSVIAWSTEELNHLGVPVSDIKKHFVNV